jgi:hypothetical protein
LCQLNSKIDPKYPSQSILLTLFYERAYNEELNKD